MLSNAIVLTIINTIAFNFINFQAIVKEVKGQVDAAVAEASAAAWPQPSEV
jgi:hypothetical protein